MDPVNGEKKDAREATVTTTFFFRGLKTGYASSSSLVVAMGVPLTGSELAAGGASSPLPELAIFATELGEKEASGCGGIGALDAQNRWASFRLRLRRISSIYMRTISKGRVVDIGCSGRI